MSTARNVLVLGATGYIGGSVLNRVLKTNHAFKYTALVRNPKDNAALESIGVKVMNGSYDDLQLVEKLASEHDIVFNCADADDLPLAKAVINGLVKGSRIESGGNRPILIHTSGTGVVSDKPTGRFNPGTSERIWNDNNTDDIKSIGEKQPHRLIDLAVFEASEKGDVDGYIVAPSTIYGKGRGTGRNISQQVPGLIKTAVKVGQAIHAGDGTNLWNHVHIDDLSDLYLLVLELALSGKTSNKSYANFFWGSVGEHQWKDIVSGIGKILHAKGLIETATPKSVELSDYPDLLYTANNSRTKSERGFTQLGWAPKAKPLGDSLEEEVDLAISQL